MRRLASDGFSLVELLTVLAVIAVFAAILVPVVGGIRESALRTKTRARFAQWTIAIEAFRAEYGYYPALLSGKVNGGSSFGGTVAPADTLFREMLGGNATGPGSPPVFQSSEGNLTAGSPRAQNTRRIPFLTFANDEIEPGGAVVDAFGNTDITVLVDSDGDGVIPAAEILAAAAQVRPPGGDAASPASVDVPPGGVRASIVILSAGAGWNGSAVDSCRMVLSWK